MRDTVSELGEYLRGMREAAELTKAEVSRRAGVAASTITEVEAGRRKMTRSDSRDTLIRWTQSINGDVARALELAGHLPRRDVEVIRQRPPLEDLIATDRTLADDQRAALLAVLRVIRQRSGQNSNGHG